MAILELLRRRRGARFEFEAVLGHIYEPFAPRALLPLHMCYRFIRRHAWGKVIFWKSVRGRAPWKTPLAIRVFQVVASLFGKGISASTWRVEDVANTCRLMERTSYRLGAGSARDNAFA